MARDGTSAADGRSRDRGDLRASRADREQAIEVLKAAFVEERLTKDELDARVGQALASRTYADLDALTSDLHAWPTSAGPAAPVPAAAGPAAPVPAAAAAGAPSTPGRILAKAASRSGICLLVALAVALAVGQTDSETWAPLAFFTAVAAVIAVSGFLGYGVADAWQAHCARRQLPPRPAQGGDVPSGQRPGPAGDDPAVPGAGPDQTRADQTRADLRAHRSRRARPATRTQAGALPAGPGPAHCWAG